MNTQNARLLAIGIILASLFAVYLTYEGPDDQPTTTEITGLAMAVPYRIVVGSELDSHQQTQVLQLISDTFDQVDRYYNQWNPDSELSRLNALPANVEVAPSPQLQSFLQLIDKLVKITEGRFDPTITPVKDLWTSKLNAGTQPTDAELAEMHQSVGWHHVHLGEATFSKDHTNSALNVDAVAKGFAVDMLAHRLQQAGYTSAYVEWGGEIKALGKHPANRPWTVYIRGIESSDPDSALAYVELENAALATSGDYHQNWTIDLDGTPKTFCHVFDPVSFRPLQVCANSVASASVLASSCAVADALATAAVACGSTQEAQAWADRVKKVYPSLTFWIASRD